MFGDIGALSGLAATLEKNLAQQVELLRMIYDQLEKQNAKMLPLLDLVHADIQHTLKSDSTADTGDNAERMA
jgi:hypothetical protein